jgi:hypothetical protein
MRTRPAPKLNLRFIARDCSQPRFGEELARSGSMSSIALFRQCVVLEVILEAIWITYTDQIGSIVHRGGPQWATQRLLRVFGKRPSFRKLGLVWIGLWGALAIQVTDEALTGFLPYTTQPFWRCARDLVSGRCRRSHSESGLPG